MAHVAPYKKEVVKNLINLIKKYPIIGALNMENMPAPQLQRMRAKMRGNVEILMTKRRLMKLAIAKAKETKPGIEKIEEHLVGMPALLFTKDNPFALFRTIKKSKSKAPAKAGQKAPYNIVVPAGPTPFAPGPVIGELGALGIKSKVEGGKISIVSDTVIAKEGSLITGPLAAMLARLSIEPMEVGLDLVAVYENGIIYDKKVLDIDDVKFMQDLTNAATWALNLSVESGYINDDNKEVFIQKAFRDSKALALEANILADAVVADILAKAEREALSLNAELPEVEIKEEKEEAKPEKPAEEKPEVKKEEKKAEKAEVKEEAKPAPVHKAEIKKEEKPEHKHQQTPAHAPKPQPEKKFATAAETVKNISSSPAKTPEHELKEKIADMVNKTKQHDDGKIPSAEKLVDEIKRDVDVEADIAKQVLKKGKRIITNEEKQKQPKKFIEGKPNDVAEVEQLMKKLNQKGTLR
jgi:large subunit ribosomal protein L10